MSNICTGVAPLTIRILRFFVRFKLGEKEEENFCYYQLSQPFIQTPNAVTTTYFEPLKRGVNFKKQNNLQDKHSPRTRYTIVKTV